MRQAILKNCMIAVILLFVIGQASAHQVVLKNGDALTGVIVSDTPTSIVLEHDVLGTVTINRAFVESSAYHGVDSREEGASVVPPPLWARSLSLGYGHTGGNTVKSRGMAGLAGSRVTDRDEWNLKGSIHYASSDQKMDSQKSYGMARHAFSFDEHKRWYNFYKSEADHDRFGNIDYRLVPAAGLGYWAVNRETHRFNLECALGYEYTRYREAQDSSRYTVVTPRLVWQKQIMAPFRVEEDLTVYLVTDDVEQYRARSEAALIHQVNQQISWRLSLVNEYNAAVSAEAKKHDYRLLYSLDYQF